MLPISPLWLWGGRRQINWCSWVGLSNSQEKSRCRSCKFPEMLWSRVPKLWRTFILDKVSIDRHERSYRLGELGTGAARSGVPKSGGCSRRKGRRQASGSLGRSVSKLADALATRVAPSNLSHPLPSLREANRSQGFPPAVPAQEEGRHLHPLPNPACSSRRVPPGVFSTRSSQTISISQMQVQDQHRTETVLHQGGRRRRSRRIWLHGGYLNLQFLAIQILSSRAPISTWRRFSSSEQPFHGVSGNACSGCVPEKNLLHHSPSCEDGIPTGSATERVEGDQTIVPVAVSVEPQQSS